MTCKLEVNGLKISKLQRHVIASASGLMTMGPGWAKYGHRPDVQRILRMTELILIGKEY
jgi:hypothetical protein